MAKQSPAKDGLIDRRTVLGSGAALAAAGPANIVTTAIARELSGFVWAIARQVAVTTD
jgi:hypothetical protein